MVSSSTTDEKDMELIYDDDSDFELEEKIEIKLGDYAVGLEVGKLRSLTFRARIDY